MKTSIVIPLGTGSRWSNTELKFALRSVEKHLTGYDDIFIIGEKPEWLQNVIHIPATDIEQTWAKERNIFDKIMLACEDPRVSDDFLFMNDDHFLLEDYVAGEFPYYYEGQLSEKMTITDYKKTINNTRSFFRKRDPHYADIHCPILYNKAKFKVCVGYPDWGLPFGYSIKTIYCEFLYNQFEELTPCPDLKINQPLPYADIINLIAGRPWFSIGDAARQGDMLQVFEDLYSVKSKYEK